MATAAQRDFARSIYAAAQKATDIAPRVCHGADHPRKRMGQVAHRKVQPLRYHPRQQLERAYRPYPHPRVLQHA